MEKIKKVFRWLWETFLKKVLKYIFISLLYTGGLALIMGSLLYIYFLLLTDEGRISAVLDSDSVSIGGSILTCNFGKELTISTGSTPFTVSLSSNSFEVDGKTYTQQSNRMYSIKSDDTYYHPPKDIVEKESETGTYRIEEAPDIDLATEELFYKMRIISNNDISAEFHQGIYGVEITNDKRMKLAPYISGFIQLRSEEPIKLVFEEHKMMLTNDKDSPVTQVNALFCPANTELCIYTKGADQKKMGVPETMEDKPYYDLEYDVLHGFQFESANSIKSVGTGKAYYFTTANPKVFELEHQEINVPPIFDISDKNDISGRLENGKLIFQGQVKSAEIMGYSIRPSVWDWMNESSNLIATMILTILGGAISLTIATLKENDGKKEKSINE